MSEQDIVKSLINKGADINAKSNWSENALMKAANTTRYQEITFNVTDQYDTIKLLIENGSKINEQNIWGNTALHFAVMFQANIEDLSVIKLLVDNSADVSMRNKEGKTPVMCIDFKKDKAIEVVKYFISQGASLQVEDIFGKNILSYATEATPSNKDLIDFLKSKGVKELHPVITKSPDNIILNEIRNKDSNVFSIQYDNNGNVKYIGIKKEKQILPINTLDFQAGGCWFTYTKNGYIYRMLLDYPLPSTSFVFAFPEYRNQTIEKITLFNYENYFREEYVGQKKEIDYHYNDAGELVDKTINEINYFEPQ